MKKLLLVLTLLLSCTAFSMKAQEGETKGFFEMSMGWSNIVDDQLSMDFKFGGITFVGDQSFLYYGLGLEMLGLDLSTTDSNGNYSEDKSVCAMYLELPVNLGFKTDEWDSDWLFQFGPTLRYGVGASEEGWFDEANRFDVALGAQVGYAVGPCLIGLGYKYGLLKAFKDSDKHYQYINLNFSIMF